MSEYMINGELREAVLLKNVEEMYIRDTEEMRKEIRELREERDLWKERCLAAEADHAQIRRQLRHI